MIKNTDIHKCIQERLRTKYNDVKITTPDITEGIIRPSFLLTLNNNSKDFMDYAKDKNTTVRIQYFSKDKNENYLENLDVQDELEELFLNQNKLYLDNGSILNISELEFDVVDKVSHCEFELSITDKYERVDGDSGNTEMMEDLDLNIEQK